MKLAIQDAAALSNTVLASLGFAGGEAALLTENMVDAELAGKKTHGLIRLLSFASQTEADLSLSTQSGHTIISESPNSLYIDGSHAMGVPILYRSLEQVMKKAQESGLVSVGLKDIGYSGYIGAYARRAAERNLVYIGFNNSPAVLVPHGITKAMWGTNPLTIGVPGRETPVILDMASTQISWGQVFIAAKEGRELSPGVALDDKGEPATNPDAVLNGGGLLPFFGHKGSGLAFMIELLAGALTGSRVGTAVPGGWGSYYILIDPQLFRPLPDFISDVEAAIAELKAAPRAAGIAEAYYPGEQSYTHRSTCLEAGNFELDDALYASIQALDKAF